MIEVFTQITVPVTPCVDLLVGRYRADGSIELHGMLNAPCFFAINSRRAVVRLVHVSSPKTKARRRVATADPALA